MPTAEALRIIGDVGAVYATSALTPRQAKLYSQRLRLEMGQQGLATFAPGDVYSYLGEAVLLLDFALLEAAATEGDNWKKGVRRAAEILEWLSQPGLKPQGVPVHLLSAAAYQLAGYPAMALGEMQRVPDDEAFSKILTTFLRGHFPSTLSAIQEFWQAEIAFERPDLNNISALVVTHVIMALGTVIEYFRTGERGLLDRALEKLDRLAETFVHSRDYYSYLLARLTAATCRKYTDTSLWPQIAALQSASTENAQAALVQFGHSSFVNRRSLVWPAQAAGIARLREGNSFVLCTPTGSGKTTVATMGIVQALFENIPVAPGLENDDSGNLVLYLVPSRALAAEVEARLAQDLEGIAAEQMIVTGLYGGVDWGPTDAWIDRERPTVVVCTFEKADALIRYLGILFLHRVRLVVVDEAHMVEQTRALVDSSTSRPLRLEQLGSRLLRARDSYDFRIIALSAVAARAAPAIARWITSDENEEPTTSDYRSTRQMLGHLEVSQAGHFTIRYDLMDGRPLRFEDERPQDTPYARRPFPSVPGGIREGGPEVAMRAPTLWAALQMAAERPDGTRPTVLISLTQSVEAFSRTAADLMDEWDDVELPPYQALQPEDERWIRCLAAAADYFSVDSVEYRLLQRGIAVHHGKMPGLMARRLKVLIDGGLIRVIIATSTLSEGVNIPVNYLLIPSVFRANTPFTLQEFTNLIGRAGRPGVATEGHALVVLPQRTTTRRHGRNITTPSRQWDGYLDLIQQIEQTVAAAQQGAPEDAASSPLGQLLFAIEQAWLQIVPNGTQAQFDAWLEQTAVGGAGELSTAEVHLDALDGFLIATLQEVEELTNHELTNQEIEDELQRVWRHTYAFAAAISEERLRNIWLRRGRAIKTVYPDATQRRRIYKTSLSPSSASNLINQVDALRNKLIEGSDYVDLTTDEKLEFIGEVLELLSAIPVFRVGTDLGRRRNFTDWQRLLRWWLANQTLENSPLPNEITNWYEFVSQNFVYRATWGLGSLLGLLLDIGDGQQPVRPLEISDWPRSGLPWIAFWLKELLTWGTLDPVAAFLLARGNALDRPSAEVDAQNYYAGLPDNINENDKLNPRAIRDWVNQRFPGATATVRTQGYEVPVDLARPAETYSRPQMKVWPILSEHRIAWVDPAGYTLANSTRPDSWTDSPNDFLFRVDIPSRRVIGELYQPHT